MPLVVAAAAAAAAAASVAVAVAAAADAAAADAAAAAAAAADAAPGADLPRSKATRTGGRGTNSWSLVTCLRLAWSRNQMPRTPSQLRRSTALLLGVTFRHCCCNSCLPISSGCPARDCRIGGQTVYSCWHSFGSLRPLGRRRGYHSSLSLSRIDSYCCFRFHRALLFNLSDF